LQPEAWKKANDPDDRFTVIDTGAASGRLAAMVLAVRQDMLKIPMTLKAVIDYARSAVENSHEYIFLIVLNIWQPAEGFLKAVPFLATCFM
jgi:hypothetical protein